MLHCFLHQQVWEIAPTDSMAIAGGRLLVIFDADFRRFSDPLWLQFLVES
jgi:hypothetical protein